MMNSHFRIASVRLIFLLSLGLCPVEAMVLPVETVAWIPGLGPAGAETLLVITGPPIGTALGFDDEGTDGEIVGTVELGFSVVVVLLPLPTAYMPILWALSPSGPQEDNVDVPVVPELGDCCLQTKRIIII